MNLFALKTAAQNKVNNVVTEGKVKFTIEKNEQGRNEMVMRYTHYDVNGELFQGCKYTPLVRNNAVNEMQVDMLVSFAVNRADFLNANYHWQAEAQKANVHPQMFKQWRDGSKLAAKDAFRTLSFHNISTK